MRWLATEAEEQASLVSWAEVTAYEGRLVSDYLVMIPNESLLSLIRDPRVRAGYLRQLFKRGFRKGASDLFLALPMPGYAGLWIEMKRSRLAFATPAAARRAVSQDQEEFGSLMAGVGYRFQVAYGWEEARELILAYLSGHVAP